MVEQQNTQYDKLPNKKWRLLKYIGIIVLVVVTGTAVNLYLSLRLHLEAIPPEQSMKFLHIYIGDTQYPSITNAECFILAGFHLDHFEWYRFNCSPDDMKAIVANLTARPGAGALVSGTANFEKVETVDREQQYNLNLNNELYGIGYFAGYEPEWWNGDILNGLTFHRIIERIAPGNTTYDLFYNHDKQTAYLHIVQG